MKNLLFIILLSTASCPVIAAPIPAQTSSEMVRQEIEAKPAQILTRLGYNSRLMDLALDAVYNDHDYQTLWYEGRGLTPRAQLLLKAFNQVEKDGLTRSDYITSSLEMV